MNPILHSVGSLYGAASSWRRRWYRDHPARQRRLTSPVISVGNLRAGGSGKTPIVDSIARLLLDRGERPVILSRGYGRRHATDQVTVVSDGTTVLADLDAAGDEPLMLGRRLAGVPVLVCADRYRSGIVGEHQFGATVHLLDDGFQHLPLARDVDLLVVDETDLSEAMLPAGRLREPLAAAAVADALLAHADVSGASRLSRELHVATVFRVVRELRCPHWVGRTTRGESVPADRPVFAVAGIARPHRFFTDLIAGGWRVAGTLSFADHYRFTAADVDRLTDWAREAGAAFVVTTEKDAVRLEPLVADSQQIAAVPLAVTVESAFSDWLMERLRLARGAKKSS